MERILFLILFAIVMVGLIRLAQGGADYRRVRHYIQAQGGVVTEMKWAPFGPGWVGKKSDRIYRLRFLDRAGNEHEAYCRTSGWIGVYFTEDHIVQYARPPRNEVEELREENQRLRAELARLQGNPPDHDQTAITEL